MLQDHQEEGTQIVFSLGEGDDAVLFHDSSIHISGICIVVPNSVPSDPPSMVVIDSLAQVGASETPREFTLPSKEVQESSVLLDAQADIDTVFVMDERTVVEEDIGTLECNNSDGKDFITPPNSASEGEAI